MARTETSGYRRHRTDSWVPITVAITLAIAVTFATKTPQEALSNPDALQIQPATPQLTLARPHVTYEVGGHGNAWVSYITDNGELAADTVALPWTLDVEMSKPMRPASVTATTLDGAPLTCRLAVDGAQQDARASEAGAGVVLCSVVGA